VPRNQEQALTGEDEEVLLGVLSVIEGARSQRGAVDEVPGTQPSFFAFVVGVYAPRKGRGIRYPVNELALRYRAGVETETTDPREAYARFGESKPVVCPVRVSRVAPVSCAR
jgi:hypothetical protein